MCARFINMYRQKGLCTCAFNGGYKGPKLVRKFWFVRKQAVVSEKFVLALLCRPFPVKGLVGYEVTQAFGAFSDSKGPLSPGGLQPLLASSSLSGVCRNAPLLSTGGTRLGRVLRVKLRKSAW